ncbi:MAG: cell division protein FtsQ/DivIB [Clostridiaceae bacterium]
MGLKEVQEKIKRKKRKRRRRILTFLFLAFLMACGIFLVKAPVFSITEVELIGNLKIPASVIQNELEGLKGQNIFTFKDDEIKGILGYQSYFEGMDMKRSLPGKVTFTLREKKPEVNYNNGGTVSLLTRDGVLLEVGANPIEDAVTLIDSTPIPELGGSLYEEDKQKASLLEEFRYLQERNISSIKFLTLDLRDMKNIKTSYNDLEVRLGYSDSLKDKLNRAINIIEGASLEATKGYIDLSYYENPVVFPETAVESPVETAAESPVEN